MDHEIDVVEQDPLGGRLSLHMAGSGSGLLQDPLDPFGDGLHLAAAPAMTDNEVVGYGPQIAQIQGDEIEGLPVERRRDCQ